MSFVLAMAVAATTLSYGAHPKQRVDVYSPSTTPRAIAVFLHGGVWQLGDRSDYVNVGEALANAGFTTYVASYRLAPEFVWPAQVEDAAAVVALAMEHAGGKRVVVIGHSAGAQLASLLAYDARWLAKHKRSPKEISALALLSGVFDLRAALDEARADGGFAQFVAPAFGRSPPKDASPISFTTKLGIPVLLVTSENDYSAMRKQTFAMLAHLKARKENVEVIVVKKVDHFGIVGALGTKDDPTLPKILLLSVANP